MCKDPAQALQRQSYHTVTYGLEETLNQCSDIIKLATGHLGRSTGLGILSSAGAGLHLQQIWGRWLRNVGPMATNYLVKNPLAALPAYAILAGFDQEFQKRHWLGRALVAVPDAWVDRIMPGVRGALQELDRRTAEPGGPSHASVRSTLRAFLRLCVFWWQDLPFQLARYSNAYSLAALALPVMSTPAWEAFTAQVFTSHAEVLRRRDGLLDHAVAAAD